MNTNWVRKLAYLITGGAVVAVFLGSFFFALQKPVSIQVDGKEIKSRVLFAGTVGDVLDKNGVSIGEHDRIEPAVDNYVNKYMQIQVTRAFKVKVIADGECREIITTPVGLEEAVAMAGFELNEKDILKPQDSDETVGGQEIEIIRVTEKELQEDAEIPCTVERVDDVYLEKGLSRTIKAGKNGLARDTIKVTYYNGVEEKRELIKSETIREPVKRIVSMGIITSVSRAGQRLNFSEARYMQSTAYTYTGNRTATGEQPAVGVVAVDPRVIPLGTRMYIEGYGYAHAGDTGGAVKGNKIDVFLEQRSQCMSWGRRTVKVYLLK